MQTIDKLKYNTEAWIERSKKVGDFWRGTKRSEETKKKMSEAKKGKPSKLKGRVLGKMSEERKKTHVGIKKGTIPWNKGKSGYKTKPASDERKKKIGLANSGKKRPDITGENNINWKGGVTPVNKLIRHSIEYRLWRTSVFERDNHTCIWCGLRSGNGKKVTLHADHIKPFAYYPELRFAIDNGRTLCVDCHKTTDTFAGRCFKFNTK